jgi:DNA-binding response OmpR family regulator
VLGSDDDLSPSNDPSTATGVPDERVLLVEPAGPLRDGFAQALRSEGFLTEAVGAAEIALELVRSWRPHLVFLDSSFLTDGSLEACKEICELTDGPTVLMPSIRGPQWVVADSVIETNRNLALLREVHSLAQRVRALESRPSLEPARQDTLEIGPITIEQAKRNVLVRGQQAHFGRLEYDLLLALVSPVGQLRTRDELLDGVWGSNRPDDANTLDVHIRRLRQKIELDMRNPRLIITVRGIGFYFDAEGAPIT